MVRVIPVVIAVDQTLPWLLVEQKKNQLSFILGTISPSLLCISVLFSRLLPEYDLWQYFHISWHTFKKKQICLSIEKGKKTCYHFLFSLCFLIKSKLMRGLFLEHLSDTILQLHSCSTSRHLGDTHNPNESQIC